MRIAYVTDEAYPGFGGQAAATEAHVRALVRLGNEVRVVVGRQKGQTEPPQGVTLYTLPVFPLGSLSHIALPRRAVLARVLDWADIVHINLPGPLAWLTMRMARKRALPVAMGLHIQEENTSMHLGPFRPVLEAILRRVYRNLFGSADCIVAPTAFAGRLARRYGPPRIEVVSNGLEPVVEDAGFADEVVALRTELLAGGDEVLLCYVGRLYPEKHPEELVALLASARNHGLKAVLAIAGRGPLVDRTVERARKLGVEDRLHLLGFVEERRKRALLRASDVFVMASEAELQSIATLEAMSCGCPVLTADYPTSAVPELVAECHAGLSYPKGDAERGGEVLVRMLADPERMAEFRREALASASAFELPVIGRRLQALYEELVAMSPGRAEAAGPRTLPRARTPT